MLNLYITRHGETIWNKEGRLQGWKNSPLTEKGVMQGKMLKKAVSEYGITRIYSSPSERAALTAGFASEGLEIPVIFMDELKEMNMGDWEGRTLEEIQNEETENFENYWTDPFKFKKNTGEDFSDILKRARKAIDRIISENRDTNVLIVTHGVTLKALMSFFADGGFLEYWRTPVVKQTSISLVKIDENNTGKIVMYGDTSHHL